MKVEKVVLVLGVSRSSVHFVENYKVDARPNSLNRSIRNEMNEEE